MQGPKAYQWASESAATLIKIPQIEYMESGSVSFQFPEEVASIIKAGADSIGEIILDESVDGKTDCIIETTLINR